MGSSTKRKAGLVPEQAREATDSARRSRIVYTAPPFQLGTVKAREGDIWLVRVSVQEVRAACDSSVDPALLEGAMQSGARVVVEGGAHAVIVGLLQTSRTLVVDREGVVDATVERFVLTARREATVRTARAFLRLRAGEVEVFGERVLTRAREVARILATMIRLN